MGLIKRKDDGKVSKGKAGAVGGGVTAGVGLLVKLANQVFGLGMPEELVDNVADLLILLGTVVGGFTSLYGIRDKQEREGA